MKPPRYCWPESALKGRRAQSRCNREGVGARCDFVCKKLRGSRGVLLIGWETPKGNIALAGKGASDMSNVFARQVLKALGHEHPSPEEIGSARAKLFHAEGHPCCLIDFQDTKDAAKVAAQARAFGPRFILLLGNDVQRSLRNEDQRREGTEVIELGFPIGTNEPVNVATLRMYPELRASLRRPLASML